MPYRAGNDHDGPSRDDRVAFRQPPGGATNELLVPPHGQIAIRGDAMVAGRLSVLPDETQLSIDRGIATVSALRTGINAQMYAGTTGIVSRDGRVAVLGTAKPEAVIRARISSP